VDVIVEVATYREFSVVQEDLRALGFAHSRNEEDHICRFVVDGIKVDVMPINGDVLGFKNDWYEAAFVSAQSIEIRTASSDVRTYLVEQFDRIIADSDFVEAISAHLLSDAASQARKSAIMERMRKIAGLRSPIE
jgi:hypothetical protein